MPCMAPQLAGRVGGGTFGIGFSRGDALITAEYAIFARPTS